jgi:hypothetical protein
VTEPSLAFQSNSPGNGLALDADSILDGNHWSGLEFESGPGRAEFMPEHLEYPLLGIFVSSSIG